jgi:WD40 repeat protein
VSDGNKVGIWSLQDLTQVSSIDQSRRGTLGRSDGKATRITAMSWINQSSDSLLMLGSDDGALRVWRDSGDVVPPTVGSIYSSESPGDASPHRTQDGPTLAAAFHALPDIADTSSGM